MDSEDKVVSGWAYCPFCDGEDGCCFCDHTGRVKFGENCEYKTREEIEMLNSDKGNGQHTGA